MRTIAIFIYVLLLSSCSTNSAITTFLEIDHVKVDEVIIFEKKIDPAIPLLILQGQNFNKKQMSNTKFYSWEDIEQLKNDNSIRQIENWQVKDFFPLKVKLIAVPENSIRSQYGRNSTDTVYYKFSETLSLKNKKTQSFYVSKSKRFGAIMLSEVIIMQKIKGKWQIVERLESLELY